MSEEIKKTTSIAIVLAGGRGTRMHSDVPKQYLELHEKPVLYYALKTFQDSFIDEIILVAEDSQKEYCREQIVEKYHFTKVKNIVSSGKERYHSVYHAIQAIQIGIEEQKRTQPDYIYIHDGARPFLNEAMLERLDKEVQKSKACVAAVPVKDTIKIGDSNKQIIATPERKNTYQIQTPQVFAYSLIAQAYHKCIEDEEKQQITDDAMVVENYTTSRIRLVEGDYHNIKITTPEDMLIAEAFLTQSEDR